jgi:hypothetical protein
MQMIKLRAPDHLPEMWRGENARHLAMKPPPEWQKFLTLGQACIADLKLAQGLSQARNCAANAIGSSS